MAATQLNPQEGMVRILQAMVDLQNAGPTNLKSELPKTLPELSDQQFLDLIIMLKSSRCIEASILTDPAGTKTIESIDGVTTRGLRELQKSWAPPAEQHSCPTDGDDGRLGFFG